MESSNTFNSTESNFLEPKVINELFEKIRNGIEGSEEQNSPRKMNHSAEKASFTTAACSTSTPQPRQKENETDDIPAGSQLRASLLLLACCDPLQSKPKAAASSKSITFDPPRFEFISSYNDSDSSSSSKKQPVISRSFLDGHATNRASQKESINPKVVLPIDRDEGKSSPIDEVLEKYSCQGSPLAQSSLVNSDRQSSMCIPATLLENEDDVKASTLQQNMSLVGSKSHRKLLGQRLQVKSPIQDMNAAKRKFWKRRPAVVSEGSLSMFSSVNSVNSDIIKRQYRLSSILLSVNNDVDEGASPKNLLLLSLESEANTTATSISNSRLSSLREGQFDNDNEYQVNNSPHTEKREPDKSAFSASDNDANVNSCRYVYPVLRPCHVVSAMTGGQCTKEEWNGCIAFADDWAPDMKRMRSTK